MFWARVLHNRACFVLFILCEQQATGATPKVIVPRFQWAQSRELIFLSVRIKDLDTNKVGVTSSTQGDLRFEATNTAGQAFVLELPLREDIVGSSLHFEVEPKPDKRGTSVLINVRKRFTHRWDRLVVDPKRFASLMERDRTREDGTLESEGEDEVPYVEEYAKVMMALSSTNLAATVAKAKVVIANIRYPWCPICRREDETFARAARLAKQRGRKEALWRGVVFGVVDAREDRQLARSLDADCDHNCGYKVFMPSDEEPGDISAHLREAELLVDLQRFLVPAVQVIATAADLEPFQSNTTCFAGFASTASPQYAIFKRAASQLRGELGFVASFGDEHAVQLWPLRNSSSYTYDGTWDDNGAELIKWIRSRAMPLVQVWAPEHFAVYSRLNLPVAVVWINTDDRNTSTALAVRRVLQVFAPLFLGRIAFIEKHTHGHYAWAELREYALNAPEVYPAFGIASNISSNSAKYGFEVTGEVAPSVQHFWSDSEKALKHLEGFCTDVLAGRWPEAHPTGIPQTNWTLGMAKRITWRTYTELRHPMQPLLLEMYNKHRPENGWRLHSTAQLAKVLAVHAPGIAVGMYDVQDNYLPLGEFPRERHSMETQWYFIKQDQHLVKFDWPGEGEPSVKAVMRFLKTEAKLQSLDVSKVVADHKEQMADTDNTNMKSQKEAELARWREEAGVAGDQHRGHKAEL
jgi:hypothetical protein